MLALEIAAVITLILINGVLALSELAVVSSRRIRLKTMADDGVRGAATALDLANDPGRFLSAVQVGITLIGILAGAFSGATIGHRLGGALASAGLPPAYADAIGIGTVVVLITYLSVIIGELVPKQLALRDPERLASLVAPAMAAMARFAGPIVTIFDASGRAVLRFLGMKSSPSMTVTDEEIKTLIREAETAGVIEPQERTMIARVMRLADRPIGAVMTPRTEVDMIDLDADPDEIRNTLRESIHSRLPAYRGTPDEIVGVLQAKDLLNAYISGGPVDPRDFCRAGVVVPDTIGALDVIESLKQSPVHMALVHDEYGFFQGIVTSADILEAITGAFRTEEGLPQPQYTRRADGSFLIEGDMPADELADLLRMRMPSPASFNTAAGFLLWEFGHLPKVGEDVVVQGWRLEVIDLDGRRIDKILAERPAANRRTRG